MVPEPPIARLALCALCASLVAPALPAGAVPPAGAMVSAAAGPGASTRQRARWIKHRVIPGELLADIADRYGVRPRKLIRWNDLDGDRPRLRAGQKLRVWTRMEPADRERVRHVVRRGESWSRIASHYGVDMRQLRGYWNRGHRKGLRVGERLVVWVEREPPESVDAQDADAERAVAEGAAVAPDEGAAGNLPIVAVRGNGRSLGAPGRGRLYRGVQMPKNDALYTLRNPDHSYGSSHTVMQLQQAIARFRSRSSYDRELVIGDMSRRRGGRFRPHRSHRSGRDVDIRLPIAEGVAAGTVPTDAGQVDWDAAWSLVQSLIDSTQVQYIFLSRSRQRNLRRAARRAGVDEQALEALIQFPSRKRTALVRHSRGHVKHIHVRFACGPDERRCRD
ncbi:MAG: penicillin-insensitive murein endopeptidase [Myxococcales bacterium]|jgi:murein endopeptidase/LysM repeat protein